MKQSRDVRKLMRKIKEQERLLLRARLVLGNICEGGEMAAWIRKGRSWPLAAIKEFDEALDLLRQLDKEQG